MGTRLATALLALVLVLLASAAEVVWLGIHNRRERERLRLESYVNSVEEASLAADEGDYPLARKYLAATAPPATAGFEPGFEWRFLWAQTAPQSQLALRPHDAVILQLAFSAAGGRLASNSADRTANWVDLARPAAAAAGLGPGGGWALAFSPDGRSCYVGERRPVGSDLVHEIDPSTGAARWTTPGYRISLSRDGSRLAVALGQPLPWEQPHGGVEVWDTASHTRVATVGGDYRAAALSPDGRLLALVPPDDSVRLWRIADGRERVRLATGSPQLVAAFSPDGLLVASCGLGEASLWRVDGGVLVAKLPHPWLRVWSVAFSPDSSRLATTCSDRTVRIWDTADGRLIRTLRGHADEVWSVAFSPDGRTVASGGKDGEVLLWPASPDPESRDLAYHGWSRPLFSPDGRTLVLTEGGPMPQALIVRDGGPARRGPAHWAACGFAADSRQLLLWSAEGPPCLRWWDLERGEFGSPFTGAEDMGGHLLMQTGISADGTRVFQIGSDWKLRVWDAAGGPPLQTLGLPFSTLGLRSVSLSREGRWFAWSLVDGNQFWIVDLASGQVRPLAGHRNEVNSVVFSPLGTEIASASSDGSVRLWDSQTGTPLATLPGHPESANDIAFSPDGRTLASLGSYQSVKFWNLATCRELLTMDMPEAGSYLAFSPDGRRLAVTLGDLEHGDDRGARIFDAEAARP